MEKKKGRPIKENPNLVKEKDSDAEAEGLASTYVGTNHPIYPVESKLSETAYGLTKISSGQQVLVRIKYDAISGKTGVPELTVVGTDRMDAEERLKIILSQELLR